MTASATKLLLSVEEIGVIRAWAEDCVDQCSPSALKNINALCDTALQWKKDRDELMEALQSTINKMGRSVSGAAWLDNHQEVESLLARIDRRD